MDINELINLMGNNCFPVVLSAYLLIRLEKQINSLAGSINKLNNIICANLGAVVSTDDNTSINYDKTAS